ncbi:MAG TPA: hypothetical protein VHM16_05395 [Rubrobacteraceae bacterium]|nr:hypothetical protein [Rubrobacteraceae bacterium]
MDEEHRRGRPRLSLQVQAGVLEQVATSAAVRKAFARELLSGGDRPPAYWQI